MKDMSIKLMLMLWILTLTLFYVKIETVEDARKSGYEEGKEYGFKSTGRLFKNITFNRTSECYDDCNVPAIEFTKDGNIIFGANVSIIGSLEMQ